MRAELRELAVGDGLLCISLDLLFLQVTNAIYIGVGLGYIVDLFFGDIPYASKIFKINILGPQGRSFAYNNLEYLIITDCGNQYVFNILKRFGKIFKPSRGVFHVQIRSSSRSKSVLIPFRKPLIAEICFCGTSSTRSPYAINCIF